MLVLSQPALPAQAALSCPKWGHCLMSAACLLHCWCHLTCHSEAVEFCVLATQVRSGSQAAGGWGTAKWGKRGQVPPPMSDLPCLHFSWACSEARRRQPNSFIYLDNKLYCDFFFSSQNKESTWCSSTSISSSFWVPHILWLLRKGSIFLQTESHVTRLCCATEQLWE